MLAFILAAGAGVQLKTMSTCGASSRVLTTDGTDDFKEGRRHLWKQMMIDPGNRNKKAATISHTKLIVMLWCIH